MRPTDNMAQCINSITEIISDMDNSIAAIDKALGNTGVYRGCNGGNKPTTKNHCCADLERSLRADVKYQVSLGQCMGGSMPLDKPLMTAGAGGSRHTPRFPMAGVVAVA